MYTKTVWVLNKYICWWKCVFDWRNFSSDGNRSSHESYFHVIWYLFYFVLFATRLRFIRHLITDFLGKKVFFSDFWPKTFLLELYRLFFSESIVCRHNSNDRTIVLWNSTEKPISELKLSKNYCYSDYFVVIFWPFVP